ncbi:Serine/threonine-protein phosphatase 7 long form homolog, partial [Linum grandiflorum]
WSKRYFSYLQEVGLFLFEGLPRFTPDPYLIVVFVERWRPETNTFHMYHGECTVTLQDVVNLTGLAVTSDVVYAEYDNKEME